MLISIIIYEMDKKQKNSSIFVLCLNPHRKEPSSRCLDNNNIREHPIECSRYYFSADDIVEKNWKDLGGYPADNLGKALDAKLNSNGYEGYLRKIVKQFRVNINKLIDDFEEVLMRVYPEGSLEKLLESIYGLKRVGVSLQEGASPNYITDIINSNFSPLKFNQLALINDKLDTIMRTFSNICEGTQKHFSSMIELVEYREHIRNSLPETFQEKIKHGLVKSKYIGSSKIVVEKGVINFPKIQKIASFLPWLYTDTLFNSGQHMLKFVSCKYPTLFNSGVLVVEESDIDTYPYNYFKSLFSKEGKGFKLVSGSPIEQFMGQTNCIVVSLELGPNPKVFLEDSEMMCKYQCELKDKRSYRIGLYGLGWSVAVIELH